MSHFGTMSELHSMPSVDPTSSLDRRASTPFDPLAAHHRRGLIVVSTFALLSAVMVLGMFIFMTIRMVFWRRFGNVYPGHNQYVVLIYNLLIADLIQSCAFALNLYWVAYNKIVAPSAVCKIQGLFIQLGDPGSGLFALAIAAHTFLQAVFGRKVPYKWFLTGILSIWGFMVVMCIIPIASHWNDPEPVFAATGAWCWLNQKHEADRLWTHYFWIFLAEFCTLLLYGVIFFQLRRKIAAAASLRNRHNNQALGRLTRVTYLMVMYPITYVVLSLPLAVGRMSTESGRIPSVTYFCVAGSMITSTGFCDVLMYTFTRRAITREHHSPPQGPATAAGNTPSAAVRTQGNPFHHHDYRTSHVATVVALSTFVPESTTHSSLSQSGHCNNRNDHGIKPKKKFTSGWMGRRERRGRLAFHTRLRRICSSSPSPPGIVSGNESSESIVPSKDRRTAAAADAAAAAAAATESGKGPGRDDKGDLLESDLSRVYQETTIEVTSEPAYPGFGTLDEEEHESFSLDTSDTKDDSQFEPPHTRRSGTKDEG